MEKYEKFLKQFGDFIFQEDPLEKADIIFIPGNGYPQMSEQAAKLWKEGYAPFVLPSGKYSIVTKKFSGVMSKKELYRENFKTEWDFLSYVLEKNGVKKSAILKENQATFTYENAIYSRKITDEKGWKIKKAIICCKATHARRCKMYYQLLFPETKLMICPCDLGINQNNWFLTKEGREEVLGEIERCGSQFHEILEGLLER